MLHSKWESYYQSYRSLRHAWRWPGVPIEIEGQVFSQVLISPKNPGGAINQLVWCGYQKPDLGNCKKVLVLREIILNLPEGWFRNEPLEDFCQAALRMKTYSSWQ